MMRSSQWLSAAVLLLVGAGLVSCGPRYTFKPLIKPVAGTVLVDGRPQSGVLVSAVAKVPDPKNETHTMGISDAQGKFELYTYDPGDGIPAGEYSLTFSWPSSGRNPTDRFKGRYDSAAKSPKSFAVKDAPVDLGNIELKSK